jgi:hypothetical protein
MKLLDSHEGLCSIQLDKQFFANELKGLVITNEPCRLVHATVIRICNLVSWLLVRLF